MRVWIFSDLHLTDSTTSLYRSLLEVLQEPSRVDDTLVFSGDIFDLLVGDSPYFKHKFSEFFTAIDRCLEKGVKVYYIEGNHDFNLSRLFPSNVHFEDESVVLKDEANQKKIYIAHGDLADPTDQDYLKLRRFLRSKALRRLMHWVPGPWIEKIGMNFSRPGEQKTADLPENWSPEKRDGLRQIYRSFAEKQKRLGFDYVVLGHCHDLDDQAPFYFNMGYPPVHRQFLFYETGDSSQKELLKRRKFPGI